MVPTVDKFDGMSWAHAATGLAQSAIRSAGVVVGLDGVEGADLDAFVAGNTGGLNLAFGGAEEVAERKQRSTRANVLAPKAPSEHAEKEDGQEEQDRNDMTGIEAGVQIPAFGESKLERLDQKKEGARDHGNRCDETGEQETEDR